LIEPETLATHDNRRSPKRRQSLLLTVLTVIPAPCFPKPEEPKSQRIRGKVMQVLAAESAEPPLAPETLREEQWEQWNLLLGISNGASGSLNH